MSKSINSNRKSRLKSQDEKAASPIVFSDIFSREEIQGMQDLFSDATGIASVITLPDGKTVTKPSNLGKLFKYLVHKTDKGLANCFSAHSAGNNNLESGIISSMGGGLWEAWVSLLIGGNHIATWSIGQVRNAKAKEELVKAYAIEKGIDPEFFINAFHEIPVKSTEQFNHILNLLSITVKGISATALKNLQQNTQIAELKKTADILQENQGYYADIFETVSEGIAHTTLTGKVLSVNKYLEHLLELPKEEIVGKNILTLANELLTINNLKTIIPVIQSVLLGKNVKGFHFQYKDKIFEIDTTKNSRTQKLTGVIRDITPHIQKEKVLRDMKWRLESIIEGTRVGTWEWNIQSGETIINEIWASIIGYTVIEFSPLNLTTLRSLIHEEDLILIDKMLAQHIAGKLPLFDMEYRIKHKKGHWVWVQDRGRIITRTDEGKPLMMFGTHTDITERKQIEEKLRESEKQYRLLFETANEGILVAQDGNFKLVNPIIPHLTGYTEEELYTIPFIEFIHPDDREQIISNYIKRLKGEAAAQKYIFRFIGKGNVIKWVEMSGAKIDWNGRPATLDFASDVTERINAEMELKHKNQLLIQVNAQKDKFFSIIAHDLRGPIGGFMGLTERMAEGMKEMTLDQLQEIAAVMKRSSTNLYNLLGNLLEWSRMQRGLTTFEPTSFLLLPNTLEIIQSAMDAALKKEIEIYHHIPENLLVFADENMLASIMRNLIANSVKFTHKGGKIDISAKLSSANHIEISVKDTGIGMNDDMIANLFSLDLNTSRKGTEGESSTGLGLIICKDFIEKHGGELKIKSKVNGGSTFLFTIPVPVTEKE